MRASRALLATLKETPAEAEIISHQLMLRGGMIRPLASGLYSWLPLGVRVMRKVEAIVREEMNAAGAQEVFMPAIQPAELWEESGRWNNFGPELLRIADRHGRAFCVGPTHEEVVTDIARREIRSYRQLPINLYQIQTKFRDEVRPRFGVMRAREFIMKDAYSFDIDLDSHHASYDAMHDAYVRIFERLGLQFRMVEADAGAIGDSRSNEFHVLADSGEDAIAFSDIGEFAANLEKVACTRPTAARPKPGADLAVVNTPGQHTIEALSTFLNVPPTQTVKTLIVESSDESLVALVVRGDRDLNVIKASALDAVAKPVTFATPDRIKSVIGVEPGSIGPKGLTIPVIVDYEVAIMADFVCGANEPDKHLIGVNWERDLPIPPEADLRNAVEGDPSPDGRGNIAIVRGIEVGHIFELGTKYSEALNAVVLDDAGRAIPLFMGCYGIGVTRVVAAAIEQNHDEKGIIWPTAIAPYQIALLPMNMHKSVRLREAVDAMYDRLVGAGLEVMLDDRAIRPGVMFADMELIGIPYRMVMGDRGLDSGTVEIRHRRDTENEIVPVEEALDYIRQKIETDLSGRP